MGALRISRDTADFLSFLVIVFGLIIVPIGLALTLLVLLRREAIKRDLWKRGCKPIRIWWIVFASWSPTVAIGLASWWAMPFRVIYFDWTGSIHKAYCWVGRGEFDSLFSKGRVQWVKDEVLG